ncbi:hypothetical protein BDZ89DRAFT_984820 [Hymenopellis radicata]|nr:hypothetical protein BDZ89DRAFT_984820 [Hymenopellis radicata]
MPKLHLKRTPQEEAHYARKRQRRREKLERANDDHSRPGPSDYTKIQAEIEEARFREKMSLAFEDDERLDSLEARMNDFAHIPMRWGGTASKNVYEGDDYLKMDPLQMDDEEYAEWVRVGMYRKTHAQEYEESQRLKAEKAAARAKRKAEKEETKRLEKALEEERQQRKREREFRRLGLAREEYDSRWKVILATPNDALQYDFRDIPWPVLSKSHVSVDDLTSDAITSFLFSTATFTADEQKKDRKDKLRETYLRFHPDKFESRLMTRVRESEQEQVRLGVGQVVRILNDQMQQQ